MRQTFATVSMALASAALLTAAASSEKQFTISDNVDLVLLDVSVKNKAGGYVSGLSQDNFRVLEDGKPRLITHFSSMDAPVCVGLIVDNSGSMRLKRPEVVTAGLAFAKESNSKDQFFVVNFNERVYFGLSRNLPFTDDLQTLRRALYYGQAIGRTALYDAIAAGLKHLEECNREMKTLIVVSDGGDNISSIRLPDLWRLLEASRATIYTIGLLDPEDRDLNPAVLQKIASATGGEYFQPDTLNSILPVFEKISKDIRNRYVIGYTPDEVNDRHEIRKVRVIVQNGEGKLSARSRTTYTMKPVTEFVATKTQPDVLHK
ncbi:MAG: VWA domain-containing protein [Acidobacteriaceae bacterium]|nr:VWA domain-containing protein [Acidobacteriaceae bacterium]